MVTLSTGADTGVENPGNRSGIHRFEGRHWHGAIDGDRLAQRLDALYFVHGLG